MRILDRLLDMSLRKVLKRLYLKESTSPRIREKTFTDPLHRRFKGGQLKGFTPAFFAERQALTAPLLQKVATSGDVQPSFLRSKELSRMDERTVEYAVTLSYLMQIAGKDRIQLLDVGCVLNNFCIQKYVRQLTQMIWFLNPSFEPLQYNQNVGYILSDIRNHLLPDELAFDVVTCLSTLEHVGMDNTRYDGAKAEFSEPVDHPEKFAIDAMRKVSRLVKAGGNLLISVPFGPFEYVYLYRKPKEPIYYTFNKQMLLSLEKSLVGFETKISVYKVIPNEGWLKTSIEDQNILKHADKCAAAGAVAFIEAIKVI